MSQIQKIINHIDNYGSITQAEAVSLYKCYRLAARISDIRNKCGKGIFTIMETSIDENGDTKRYARYVWSN